jgi:hypothetical protein
LALMNVDLIYIIGHDNVVLNVIKSREELQAMGTTQVLRLLNNHGGDLEHYKRRVHEGF